MSIRITTWNVNGIRNPFGHPPWRESRTFDAMFDILEADIVVMQELKIQRKDLRDDMVLVSGWDCYFTVPKAKKGYSGVAIYTRQAKCAPIRAEEGVLGVLCPPDSSTPYCELPADRSIGGYLKQSQLAEIDALGVDPMSLDTEGRCLILEFPAFVILGVYSPANSNGLRDDFRYGFVCALDMRIRNLEELGKRVILTGDLNVSRDTIDTANFDERLRKEDMTFADYASMPNRRIFHQLLEDGEVFGERDPDRQEPVLWDVCRGFHPGRTGMYTHWEQKINARPGNYGSRIDYVLASIRMKSWFSESNIQEGLMGSDHCPVYAVMKDQVEMDGKEVHLLDIMNPPGMFEQGQRKREWNAKDIPSLSGRLLPEFHQRRSIKDMFSKRPTDLAKSESTSTPIPVSTPSPGLQPESSMPDRSQPESKATSASPEKKRPTPGSPQNSRSLKRTKSAVSTSNTGPTKGQKTLQGFFKPKTQDVQTSAIPVAYDGHDSPKLGDSQSSSVVTRTPNDSQSNGHTEGQGFNDDTGASTTDASTREESTGASARRSPESEDVFDPIVSKESWEKLFSNRGPPKCDHREPCISLTTKKPGFNCGRSFWICPRPLGPSGNKERGTQWRCHTFIWASDWTGQN